MNKVVVIGSINMDTTYLVEKIPLPGQTVAVQHMTNSPGGKGANQSVAAARSGAEVSFIGNVGDDDFGKTMVAILKDNQIDTSLVSVDVKHRTGAASVIVDQSGQNSILVYPGANFSFDARSLQLNKNQVDFVVSQFEVSQENILHVFKEYHATRAVTVLNPAPAKEVDEELLSYTDVIIPNETECEYLTGVAVNTEKDMLKATKILHNKGIGCVLITLGDRGVFYSTKAQAGIVPSFKVKAVDTTSAGDTFIGSLISQLKPDFSNLEEAIKYAQCASSIAVQKEGALISIPDRVAIETQLVEYGVK